MPKVSTPAPTFITFSGAAATITLKAGGTPWTPQIPSTVQTSARPQREALTIPGGSDPLRISGSVIVNYGVPGTALAVRALELLAGVQADGSIIAVSPITVAAQAQLVPYAGDGWLIETGPAWDDSSRRLDAGGNLLFIEGTLTLVRERVDQTLKTRAAKARSQAAKTVAKRSKNRKRSHLIKAGETLSSIADHELGDADRWEELARLNSIRDPRHLVVGKRLKLPQH